MRPHFDAVIVALPADRAAELVWPLDSMLGGALGEIEYASSAHRLHGPRAGRCGPSAQWFGPRRARRGEAADPVGLVRQPQIRRPRSEGEVVLRTFVGGALQPEILDHTRRRIDSDCPSPSSAKFWECAGEPRFAVVSRHKRAMPQYHVGHLDRVRRIEELAAAHPRLALAGNAYEGVGIPDCIGSGERAAERVFQLCSPAARP